MKCSDCGKKIEEDYQPSNFCRDCVEGYVQKKVKVKQKRTKYFETDGE